jgi:enterochelin esterase-like enzyme
MRILVLALTCLVVALAPEWVVAQTPGIPATGPGQTSTIAIYAPIVRPDRTVTLRLVAPTAAKVEFRPIPLVAAGGQQAMSKEANGVWAVTVGPLDPDIYRYSFLVDGARVADPSNTWIDVGRSTHFSLFEVPGTPARFDEWQNVPHGTMQIREYVSSVLNARRRVVVYVPPQYESEPTRRFPVLYLRHGNGDLEEGWSGVGRAGVILDNLLAQRAAEPMLIVMPNGYSSTDGEGTSPSGITLTARELTDDIIPMIEKSYRILATRENRAIAGLSMGGRQAFVSGLRDFDTFAWIGVFSIGGLGDMPEAAVLNDPRTKERLRLLLISCGTEDERYQSMAELASRLKTGPISHRWLSMPGNHEWKVWRRSLVELLPLLFKANSATASR